MAKLQQVFVCAKFPEQVISSQQEQEVQNFSSQVMQDLESAFTKLGHGEFLEVCSSVDHDFFYGLASLENPITEQQSRELKQKFLELYPETDLLFSPDFPCFYSSDQRSGALVMDMDMTTVQIEGIDEIARRLGVFDEVAAITLEAMQGKLDFSQSLRKRVALLKGGNAAEILGDVGNHMPETSGLQDLMKFLEPLKSQISFQTCIASGGFHNLIHKIDEKYGLTQIRANRLAVDAEGKFTGEVDGPIVDAQAKANLVKELKDQGIPQERIIVLGDGANDMLMMKEGGLGIAYHAKAKVQAEMLNSLNHGDLRAVMELLNLRFALDKAEE